MGPSAACECWRLGRLPSLDWTEGEASSLKVAGIDEKGSLHLVEGRDQTDWNSTDQDLVHGVSKFPHRIDGEIIEALVLGLVLVDGFEAIVFHSPVAGSALARRGYFGM